MYLSGVLRMQVARRVPLHQAPDTHQGEEEEGVQSQCLSFPVVGCSCVGGCCKGGLPGTNDYKFDFVLLFAIYTILISL